MTDAELLSTPVGFASEFLSLDLYDWQAEVVTWYEEAGEKTVQGTLATPNESGKSSMVIPTLVLWWLSVHKMGKVVVTTKSGLQLDSQVLPSIRRHAAKFESWRFNEREIFTPTGGQAIFFTTDEFSRAEGHHPLVDKVTGPVLIIIDEAKSVDQGIFDAIDRCGYSGLLYTSSPGAKTGRFYESHYQDGLGFRRKRVGLRDCPHITQEKIDRIVAKHGPDSPFTLSTLHGQFMDAEGEARFDRDGLAILKAQAEAGARTALIGSLDKGSATSAIQFTRESAGWLWLDEEPKIGGEYLISGDPNTMEQGEGAKDRDNTAIPVIRKAYIDEFGVEHPDHVVAALHWPGGVKWDSDVAAPRIALLAEWFGNCMVVVESNNFGSALIKELQRLGVRLWQRTRVDDVNPNKTIKTLGWLTTERTREHWVQSCTKALRCNEDAHGRKSIALRCRYQPAVDEFHTFIFTPDGRGEAQAGTHDDWVAAIGIGLTVRCFTRLMAPRPATVRQYASTATPGGGWE